MRAVSFVSRVEFEFKGNFSRNAICLGDVDNDGDNELVVGNLQGDLAVFKGNQSVPWAEAHDLKMIMVVIVGDVLNEGKNFAISISGEGLCCIFSMDVMMPESERQNWRPFHTQQLPANTKVALLADVDGDGEVELVLGLTDHVLRTYRWVNLTQASGDTTGKLVGLHKWEFADQIGSISLNPCAEGCPYVLVAQPGGTYINFECPLQLLHDVTDSTAVSKLTPKHHPLASSRMRNRSISSEILGGIKGTRNGKKTNSLIAVATLDGTLMLVDNDEILWSLQVDHQLFALTKLDLIGDGEEEVIACAWDGQTYMVNQQRQSVRFQFDEPVCAFTSGMYSISPGHSIPSLVYATFSDRIHLYYDVRLPSFRIHSLLENMEQLPETTDLLSQFPIDWIMAYSVCVQKLFFLDHGHSGAIQHMPRSDSQPNMQTTSVSRAREVFLHAKIGTCAIGSPSLTYTLLSLHVGTSKKGEDSRQLRNFYSFCLYGYPLSLPDEKHNESIDSCDEAITVDCGT